jgi:hypothetical protein
MSKTNVIVKLYNRGFTTGADFTVHVYEADQTNLKIRQSGSRPDTRGRLVSAGHISIHIEHLRFFLKYFFLAGFSTKNRAVW